MSFASYHITGHIATGACARQSVAASIAQATPSPTATQTSMPPLTYRCQERSLASCHRTESRSFKDSSAR
jgi:hypothetical protein